MLRVSLIFSIVSVFRTYTYIYIYIIYRPPLSSRQETAAFVLAIYKIHGRHETPVGHQNIDIVASFIVFMCIIVSYDFNIHQHFGIFRTNVCFQNFSTDHIFARPNYIKIKWSLSLAMPLPLVSSSFIAGQCMFVYIFVLKVIHSHGHNKCWPVVCRHMNTFALSWLH